MEIKALEAILMDDYKEHYSFAHIYAQVIGNVKIDAR
ncbi:hypothetical protein BVRB_6g147620 [Beta vulgaris subsp. vulgaris]|nr:hypothetical protein BVRB_6g147620 [Beta vulgaris subsp. vulgaris]